MTTKKLKALVNTVIKQSTVDSSEITDSNLKFLLAADSEIEINSYKSAPNNHWELELTSPVNNVTKWYAYSPHVTIQGQDALSEILQEIKNSRFNVYHKPTEQDQAGLGFSFNEPEKRSERIYPPYVLGPRRQVDSLVRQLNALLPVKDTAFIIAERLVHWTLDKRRPISVFTTIIKKKKQGNLSSART